MKNICKIFCAFSLIFGVSQCQKADLQGDSASDSLSSASKAATVVANMSLEDDLLPGSFSVSPSSSVRFAKGNLWSELSGAQYHWHFEEEQFDYRTRLGNQCIIGGYYQETGTASSDCGLFYFTEDGGYGSCPSFPGGPGHDVDWGVPYCLSNNLPEGTWTTLSAAEWVYLSSCRTGKVDGVLDSQLSFLASITMNDGHNCNGIVLLPDGNWTTPSHLKHGKPDYARGMETVSRLSIEDWSLFENAGAVFFPVTGELRNGNFDNSSASLWSMTLSEYDQMVAYAARFPDYGINLIIDDSFGHPINQVAYSVRLVRRNKIHKPSILIHPCNALPGSFSVSWNKKVHFAKGNVWLYSPGPLLNPESVEMEQNQYDYRTESGLPCCISGLNSTTPNRHYGVFPQSVNLINGMDKIAMLYCNMNNIPGDTWRTLSKADICFLFNRHGVVDGQVDSELNGSGQIILDNGGLVNGYILLPDGNWTTPSGIQTTPSFTPDADGWCNRYTVAEWARMEKAGAVFLPAAGIDSTGIQEQGGYWTSTFYYEDWTGVPFLFSSNNPFLSEPIDPDTTLAIRMVTDKYLLAPQYDDPDHGSEKPEAR